MDEAANGILVRDAAHALADEAYHTGSHRALHVNGKADARQKLGRAWSGKSPDGRLCGHCRTIDCLYCP